MICPQCNAENRDTAKFCDECGTRLLPAAPLTAEEIPAIDDFVENDLPSMGDPADAEKASPSVDDVDGGSFSAEQGEQRGGSAESSCDSEGAGEPASPSAAATGVIDFSEKPLASEASQTRRIDLSGFDEFASEGSYSIPSPSWRDGGTMRMPRIESTPAPDAQKSFRAAQKRSGMGKGVKVALGIVAGLLVCAGLAAFVTYQMELWGGKMVPDVVGLTQADATNTLESKGFTVRSTQVKSDETEGIVLLMDPTGNSRLDEGGEVVIHVAAARSIPQIVGSQRTDAEAAIAAEGLSNVTYVTQRSDEEEGKVLSVEPAEGQKVRAGTAVTVTIAEPYTVPSVEGMGQEEAKAAVKDAGYAPYVTYVYNEDLAEGTVIGTDPAAGERLPSGSDVAIQVVLSRATELVNATYSLFSQGSTVTIDGVSYTVDSCDAASYQGNETTSYTITATPFTYFLGVYLPLDARSVSGTITWSADNTVASASPSLSVG